MRFRRIGFLVFLAALSGARAGAKDADEFFIVSSIDAARGRIVLKRPTETTVTMRVTDRTSLQSERGRKLRLVDLRAGDTAFITSAFDSGGESIALSVRIGPMTVPELERRYLKRSPQGSPDGSPSRSLPRAR